MDPRSFCCVGLNVPECCVFRKPELIVRSLTVLKGIRYERESFVKTLYNLEEILTSFMNCIFGCTDTHVLFPPSKVNTQVL